MIVPADYAAALADRIRAVEFDADPWPHGCLDGFFPPDVFAEFVTALPTLEYGRHGVTRKKSSALPPAVSGLCRDPGVLSAIRERWKLPDRSTTWQLEVAYTGRDGLAAHCDRPDKLWSGLVYLDGDPKGTELFDAAGRLAKVVEWRPNRLVGWTRPAQSEKHAVPKSAGRYVLLYWLMTARI